jgi:hypothetical protein
MKGDGSYAFKTGYLKNGNPIFRSSNSSWIHLGSYSQGDCNFVKFTRKIRVCDVKNNYIDIIGNTALVLFGYGIDQQLNAADPKVQFKAMGRIYNKPVPFLSTANIMRDLSKYTDLETYDFVTNVI